MRISDWSSDVCSSDLTAELKRLADAAALAVKNGIEVHAGHGLSYENVQPVAAIPQVRELNIGHFLVGEAIFIGLADSVRRMRDLMDAARAGSLALVPISVRSTGYKVHALVLASAS